MPIGFMPGETTTVPLDCIDKGKADGERAKFTVRFITAGEAKCVAKLEREARSALSPGDADALLNQAIRIGIVGWEGLVGSDGNPVVYRPAPLPPPVRPVPTTTSVPPASDAAAPDDEPATEAEPDVLDEFSTRLKFQIVQEYPWAITLSKPERFQ